MIETKFKQTEAGLIPEDWEIVALEKLFQIGNGYTPSKNVPAYWNNGTLPWFRMEDIRTNGRILKDSIQHITPLAVKSSGLFPANSIIISTTATIGEHALLIADSLANQRFTFLWNVNRAYPSDKIYLFYHCFSLGDYCRNNINYGGLTAVNMTAFKKYPFILPPLPEQQRIAEALSDVDALISSLGKMIEKKRNIKLATMQQLLTGKQRLPGFTEPWEEKEMCEIVQRFATGLNPRTNFQLNNGGTNFYVTIKNFKDGCIYLDDGCDKIDNQALILINKRSQLQVGDILFSSIGRVGDAAIIKTKPENWNINESVFVLRPDYALVTTDYLYYTLKSDYCQNVFKNAITGSTLQSIKMSHLREIKVLIPLSITEQSAIANILTDMDNEIAKLETRKKKYEAIKQGMMQQLLTGKIRLTNK